MTMRGKKVVGSTAKSIAKSAAGSAAKSAAGSASKIHLAAKADVPPRLTLPRAKAPHQSEFHVHATLLEVSDSFRLKVLSENPRIGPYLLSFLSNTVVLVDPAGVDELIKALRAEGDPPRIVSGRTSS